MPLKKQIEAILASDYRGPRAGYGEVDVLKAIYAIGKSTSSVGRHKLGQLTGLGQGEVRTLISRLKDNELIVVDSKGITFAEKGRKEFDSMSKLIPDSSAVDASDLDLGKFTWFIIVRDRASKVKKGLEQRDAAIRAGAAGALTVIYSGNKFKIPSPEVKSGPTDSEAMGPAEPWTTIRKVSHPKDGDVVIVSGADTRHLAEEGALAAALTIL
ncbi:MAG: hypothetical protein OK457_07910 [Thaumarchaeota archaeon]|nr:hypothetical protein [Nitrososphaerota archaeon]